jgi:hypothetical protein
MGWPPGPVLLESTKHTGKQMRLSATWFEQSSGVAARVIWLERWRRFGTAK